MLANGFTGERLQLARDFRGFTQTELGHKAAVSPKIISLLERNQKVEPPTDDLVKAFSEVLGFDPSFFFRQLTDPFLESECNFRHRRTAPEKIKSRVRAHATLIGEIAASLRSHFRFPEFNFPRLKVGCLEDIEGITATCREHWKLGSDNPIMHVGRVIERAGVPIITGIVEGNKVHAFSRKGPTSLVFLNQYIQSPSHWAFDLGHECGHLVLHDGITTGDKDTEAQADRFASAFLLPERAFKREFGSSRRISWPRIFELKRRWRVSAAAIVRRAYDLAIIDAVAYRHAYQYISMKKWNRGEPDEPTFQPPELFIPALLALGVSVKATVDDLREGLGLPLQTFTDITGHAPIKPLNSRQVLSFPKKQ